MVRQECLTYLLDRHGSLFVDGRTARLLGGLNGADGQINDKLDVESSSDASINRFPFLLAINILCLNILRQLVVKWLFSPVFVGVGVRGYVSPSAIASNTRKSAWPTQMPRDKPEVL
jgi:hypothetical protein